MKKRNRKKLVLGRETLQQLEAAHLSEAAGGALTVGASCVPACIYPSQANISACKKCFV